jgi:ribosomal protein L11 methyltransferase
MMPATMPSIKAAWTVMKYYELSIRIAERYKDKLIRKLTESGCLGVIEEDDSIVAYFPDTIDIDEITTELSVLKELLGKSHQAKELIYQHSLIPDRDWNKLWKKGFHPIDVGRRFTILPPWEKKGKNRINLVIDPGMAFGTGHHGTTRSCLVLMERYARRSGKKNFLDLGTGTGILAIAATHLGYKKVVAVDIDPLAIAASRKNAKLNKAKGIEIRTGSIADIRGTYDFIAANLISGVLAPLAPAIATRLKPRGFAVLSGILSGQEREVLDAMLRTGLQTLEEYYDDKWVSLVVGHRPELLKNCSPN